MEWLHSGSSWPSQRRIVDELANPYIDGKCGFLAPAGPDLHGSSNCQYSRALDNVRDPAVCTRHQTYVLVVISERFRNHGGNPICQTALGDSPAWILCENSTPSMDSFTGQSDSRLNLGTQKNELASKYIVTTDDCLYEICIRCVPSTWLTCPNDTKNTGYFPDVYRQLTQKTYHK